MLTLINSKLITVFLLLKGINGMKAASWFKDLFNIQTLSDLQAFCRLKGIKFSQDKGLITLDYIQTEAQSSDYFTRFCRGLILDENLNVVARSFNRFFNHHEQFTDLLLEEAIRQNRKIECYEKMDGSLIKLFFNPISGLWQIGTRGSSKTHSLAKADISYHDAFVNAVMGLTHQMNTEELLQFIQKKDINHVQLLQLFCQNEDLNPSQTYIFELCSLFNQMVVPYQGLQVFFLA